MTCWPLQRGELLFVEQCARGAKLHTTSRVPPAEVLIGRASPVSCVPRSVSCAVVRRLTASVAFDPKLCNLSTSIESSVVTVTHCMYSTVRKRSFLVNCCRSTAETLDLADEPSDSRAIVLYVREPRNVAVYVSFCTCFVAGRFDCRCFMCVLHASGVTGHDCTAVSGYLDRSHPHVGELPRGFNAGRERSECVYCTTFDCSVFAIPAPFLPHGNRSLDLPWNASAYNGEQPGPNL